MEQNTSWLDHIEENLIASLLGIMTLLTFANVVARYVFNSNIFWALELTVFLFAWLVLLGASYAVKKTSHLGVDAIVNMLSIDKRRILALFTALVCILYALLLLNMQTFLRLKGDGFQQDLLIIFVVVVGMKLKISQYHFLCGGWRMRLMQAPNMKKCLK